MKELWLEHDSYDLLVEVNGAPIRTEDSNERAVKLLVSDEIWDRLINVAAQYGLTDQDDTVRALYANWKANEKPPTIH